MRAYALPTLLLVISNVFMTVAWYGHLRHQRTALWLAVVTSWGIAFFEYCFQVPANRVGAQAGLAASQLKVLQEAITLVVFAVFARVYLGERLAWNHALAFVFVLAAVFLVNHRW